MSTNRQPQRNTLQTKDNRAQMDRREATQILNQILNTYRCLEYRALVTKVGDIDCQQASGPSGASYQVEVQVVWDHKPQGDVRVMAGIDDGGLSFIVPLCADFIISPTGEIKDR